MACHPVFQAFLWQAEVGHFAHKPISAPGGRSTRNHQKYRKKIAKAKGRKSDMKMKNTKQLSQFQMFQMLGDSCGILNAFAIRSMYAALATACSVCWLSSPALPAKA